MNLKKNLRRQKKLWFRLIALCLAFVLFTSSVGFAEIMDLRKEGEIGGTDLLLSALFGSLQSLSINPNYNVIEAFTATYLIPKAAEKATKWLAKELDIKNKYLRIALEVGLSVAGTTMLDASVAARVGEEIAKKAKEAAEKASEEAAEKAYTETFKSVSAKKIAEGATEEAAKEAAEKAAKKAAEEAANEAAKKAIKEVYKKAIEEIEKGEEVIGGVIKGTGGEVTKKTLQIACNAHLNSLHLLDPNLLSKAAKPTQSLGRILLRKIIKGFNKINNSRLMNYVYNNIWNRAKGIGSKALDFVLGPKAGNWVKINLSALVNSIKKLPSKTWNFAKGCFKAYPGQASPLAAGLYKGTQAGVYAGTWEYLYDEFKEHNDKYTSEFLSSVAALITGEAAGLGLSQATGIVFAADGKYGIYALKYSRAEALKYAWSNFKDFISKKLPKVLLPSAVEAYYASRGHKEVGVVFSAGLTYGLERDAQKDSFASTFAKGLVRGGVSVGLQKISAKRDNPVYGAMFNLIGSSIIETGISALEKNIKNNKEKLGFGDYFSLFIANLSANIAKANADIMSMGRAIPTMVDEIGKPKEYTFEWHNPNNIFWIARYYDYIKDYKKYGFNGALMNQFVSAYHYQAVNNVNNTLLHGLHHSALKLGLTNTPPQEVIYVETLSRPADKEIHQAYENVKDKAKNLDPEKSTEAITALNNDETSAIFGLPLVSKKEYMEKKEEPKKNESGKDKVSVTIPIKDLQVSPVAVPVPITKIIDFSGTGHLTEYVDELKKREPDENKRTPAENEFITAAEKYLGLRNQDREAFAYPGNNRWQILVESYNKETLGKNPAQLPSKVQEYLKENSTPDQELIRLDILRNLIGSDLYYYGDWKEKPNLAKAQEVEKPPEEIKLPGVEIAPSAPITPALSPPEPESRKVETITPDYQHQAQPQSLNTYSTLPDHDRVSKEIKKPVTQKKPTVQKPAQKPADKLTLTYGSPYPPPSLDSMILSMPPITEPGCSTTYMSPQRPSSKPIYYERDKNGMWRKKDY